MRIFTYNHPQPGFDSNFILGLRLLDRLGNIIVDLDFIGADSGYDDFNGWGWIC